MKVRFLRHIGSGAAAATANSWKKSAEKGRKRKKRGPGLNRYTILNIKNFQR